MLVLYMLVQAAYRDGVFPQPGPASVSASGMARRLGCSRMHVQRLLREAERAGFITRLGVEGIAVTPLLCDRLSLFATLLFTLNGAIARRALRKLGRDNSAPRQLQTMDSARA
jgi:DNA-binding GntR family transcriptional regulator